MSIPLSDIQEILERTVYHRLRLECVDKGYLPDITTYPKTEAGEIQYQNDLQIIRDTLGFAVEVFNAGNPKYKGEKIIPRIVINSQDFMPGALGGANTRYYKSNVGGFSKMLRPPQTSDYYYNIHLVADNITEIRVLNALTAIALPRRGYIPIYNNPNQNIFTQVISTVDYTDNTDEIIEKVYRYQIPDIFEVQEIDGGSFAKIQNIDVDILVKEDNSDTLEIT